MTQLGGPARRRLCRRLPPVGVQVPFGEFHLPLPCCTPPPAPQTTWRRLALLAAGVWYRAGAAAGLGRDDGCHAIGRQRCSARQQQQQQQWPHSPSPSAQRQQQQQRQGAVCHSASAQQRWRQRWRGRPFPGRLPQVWAAAGREAAAGAAAAGAGGHASGGGRRQRRLSAGKLCWGRASLCSERLTAPGGAADEPLLSPGAAHSHC